MKRGLLFFLSATAGLLCLAGLSQSQPQYPPQIPRPIPRPIDPLRPVPFHSDGRSGWRLAIPGNHPLATPAIADGKLYIGGGFGSHEFYSFDAISGRSDWIYHTADDGPTAAVVENGEIAFNTESCELEILTTRGRPIWKKWLGDPLMSMPAMADGSVYMAFPDSRGRGTYYLAAFDLSGGREIWRSALPSEIITAPVIEGDKIYASTVGGILVAFNRRDGTRIWEDQRNATSAPALWNGQTFFSRREAVASPQAGTQQTELMASRAAAAPSAPPVELRDTQHNSDYRDYATRAQT